MLNHTLNMIETQVATKMMEAYVSDPERSRGILERGRKFRVEFEARLTKRTSQNLQQRIEDYKLAEKQRKEKAARKAHDIAEMAVEAAKWTHLPLIPARRSGTEPSIQGQAAEIQKKRAGTENQNEAAVTKWAVRWLTVFETVFDLDQVPELTHVFYGATGRASIQAGRNQADLLQNLADCSQYMSTRAEHFERRRREAEVVAP